ncbi:MAG: antibiotic biosynthesis monooxygenase [Chloroflexi bacterium]|nr:antibiotic biosynthesis monooxygenase [Chloroflexota bacterium]
MYVLSVTAHVLPNKVETFLHIIMEYALATRKESGNVRYDILQSEDDPSCFVIYEAYRTKEDFMIHRETPHSARWKTETEFLMAKPRERIRCQSLFFSD